MMTTTPLTVNGKPFFGRVEEQKRFRAALHETLDPPPGEDLPYVFLLYGDGGIGKTTLARRFRDIATEEVPFEGEVETLWLDWEEERRRSPALQVGREHIAPETVFDLLFTAAQRANWEKHFKDYRETLKKRREVEHAAAQALSGAEERPELAALRGAGAATLAKILRLSLPIGESGEKLSKAFLEAGIQVGAEQAYALRQSLETRLRARLGVEQYALYVNPLEGLARALADGFRRLSRKRPLLAVLDTYEIVDYSDHWLRMVLRLAGPRILWVLSGRDDLVNSRTFGRTYFKGYAEDWPRRLAALNMTQLARDDVAAYFAAVTPDRPLDAEALEALRRATRGIPLAVAQAAEMWTKGVPLADIVAEADEALPGREIVTRMAGRYLLHAVTPQDRYALYALALARGDRGLLHTLLAPAEDPAALDLNAELGRLEREYASVYAGEARLHDEPQTFFEAHLRDEAQRADPRVRALLERGAAELEARLARIAADYDLLEERLEDEDYLQNALRLTDFLFWLEEDRAWRWFVPRFVEAIAYNPDLRRGLLETASRWRKALSARGRKRLKALQAAEDWWPDVEDLETHLRELERLARRGYLAGEGEAERRAILAWQRGRLLYRQGRYEEALAAYEAAERGLPPDGETLREKLAEALDNLANELMWPDNAPSSVYHPDAVRILRKVTAWLPEKAEAWYRLGVALDDSGEKEDALAAYRKAIELDEKLAAPWNGLGNVYRDLGRHEDAIAAYKKSLELQPRATPWNGLGLVYEKQGEYEQAIAHYRKALEIDPEYKWAYANLGDVYRKQGRYEDAIAAYRKAIALDEKYAYPWNGLGNVYDDLGRYEDAIAAYRKAIALDEKLTAPWHGLGNVYRDLGRHEEAIEAFQKAIALDEKLTAPWYGLGNVYCDLGRHEEAIEAFQKAIALDEDFAYPWNGLGNVYYQQGRHEEAIAAYQKAIALEPENPLAYGALFALAISTGNRHTAMQILQKARDAKIQLSQGVPVSTIQKINNTISSLLDYAIQISQPEPYLLLGPMLLITGQAQEALSAFQNALRAEPVFFENLDAPLILSHPAWPRFISEFAYLLTRNETAPFLPQQRKYLAQISYMLAESYRALGRYDEAIAAYRKAIELDEKYAAPWNGLGNVYDALGRHEDAIAAFQKAIALVEKAAYPWHGLGLTYTLQGDLEAALEAFRKAVELAPEDGMVRGSLAGILRRLGREEEARREEEIARLLMAKEDEYNRACFAALCGDVEEALRLLAIALEKRQTSLTWARQDPDFESLHADPRFWALVGGSDG